MKLPLLKNHIPAAKVGHVEINDGHLDIFFNYKAKITRKMLADDLFDLGIEILEQETRDGQVIIKKIRLAYLSILNEEIERGI